jgi:hypothetical protein
MLFRKKALNLLASYEILTRPKVSFASLLRLEGRRRCDRRIPRESLHDYSNLAFKCLLDSGNDQSLLNACGHDHAFFWSLVELFEPIYDSNIPNESSGFILLVPLVLGKQEADHNTWMLQGDSVLFSSGIVPEVQYLGPPA